MTGSLRALLVLVALAAIGVVVALVDGPAKAVDHALVPGLDIAKISKIDVGEVHLVRDGAMFRWDGKPVDGDTIDRMMTALRGGHWHRRRGLDATSRTADELRIDDHEIQRGQPLAGAEQTWIVVDDAALLVDNWVVTALFPEPLALRVRHPFAGAGRGTLELGTVRLDGTRLDRGDVHLEIRPELRAQLVELLTSLEIVALPPRDAKPAAPTVEIDGVKAIGTCGDDLVWLAAASGDGCVSRAAWTPIVALVDQLRSAPPEALVDRRPAAAAKRVVLVDKTAIDLVKIAPMFDPARVAELAAALAAPAEIATGTAKVTGVLEVDGEPVELYDDGSISRTGESVRLMPAGRDILRRTGAAFRDPRLWVEEPTTIATIEIDGKTARRGAVIGEWTGGNAKLLDELADALASPTTTPATPFAEHAHHVAIQIHRPDGGETRHEIDLTADCRGNADGRAVQLPPRICTLVVANLHSL